MRAPNTKLHFDNIYFGDPIVCSRVQVYQIGDCLARDGFLQEEHTQSCDEISYIVSGDAVFWLNGRKYDVHSGDIFFCPKGSTHKIVTKSRDPVRYFYLGFELIGEDDDWREIRRTLRNVSTPICRRATNFYGIFSELLSEFRQELPRRDTAIELGVMQIILHAYRCFTLPEKGRVIYQKQVPDKTETVYEIVNFIDNNVLKIRSLTDISHHIGFSYSYTSQIFSSVMKVSLSDYYQEKRFDEAVKLLKGGMSVTHCSELLGFESVNSFSRAFKTRFGVSPQQYIKDQK